MSDHHEVELSYDELSDWLDGSVSAARDRAIRLHLEGCTACRTRLDKIEQLYADVKAPLPELENVDLLPDLKARMEEAARPTPKRSSPWIHPAFLGAIAASLAAVAVAGLLHTPEEVRVKGSGSSSWLRIEIFQREAGGGVKRLDEVMRSEDALLFAYSNLGPEPFQHLMIFAVDADREVRWYYPQYREQGSNPPSIRAEPGVDLHELPYQVSHPLPPGPLTITALFTRAPLRVNDIEAWVTQGSEWRALLPEGAGIVERSVRVQR